MNFLFGALLLIIILLPGVILRASYLSTSYGKRTFKFSVADEIILSLIPTLLLQGTFYAVTNYFIININEQRLFYLFTNSDKVFATPLPDWNILLFFLYTLVICVVSAALGVWARKFVQRKRLFIKYPILRFYNDWHYILRGIILDFPGHEGDAKNVSNVWVDVVTINKDDAYIYSGFLKEYYLTKDDGLDRIYLTNVQRRKLSEDSITNEGIKLNTSIDQLQDALDNVEVDYDAMLQKGGDVDQIAAFVDNRYYFMPGDYFVIPYSEIKNINITYYTEQELPEE